MASRFYFAPVKGASYGSVLSGLGAGIAQGVENYGTARKAGIEERRQATQDEYEAARQGRLTDEHGWAGQRHGWLSAREDDRGELHDLTVAQRRREGVAQGLENLRMARELGGTRILGGGTARPVDAFGMMPRAQAPAAGQPSPGSLDPFVFMQGQPSVDPGTFDMGGFRFPTADAMAGTDLAAMQALVGGYSQLKHHDPQMNTWLSQPGQLESLQAAGYGPEELGGMLENALARVAGGRQRERGFAAARYEGEQDRQVRREQVRSGDFDRVVNNTYGVWDDATGNIIGYDFPEGQTYQSIRAEYVKTGKFPEARGGDPAADTRPASGTVQHELPSGSGAAAPTSLAPDSTAGRGVVLARGQALEMAKRFLNEGTSKADMRRVLGSWGYADAEIRKVERALTAIKR